jgi:hypothetical protein
MFGSYPGVILVTQFCILKTWTACRVSYDLYHAPIQQGWWTSPPPYYLQSRIEGPDPSYFTAVLETLNDVVEVLPTYRTFTVTVPKGPGMQVNLIFSTAQVYPQDAGFLPPWLSNVLLMLLYLLTHLVVCCGWQYCHRRCFLWHHACARFILTFASDVNFWVASLLGFPFSNGYKRAEL